MRSANRKVRIEYEMASSSVVRVNISGDAGMGSVPSMDAVLTRLIQEGYSRLIIDLSETTYLASAAIGALIRCADLAREKGGEVALAGVSNQVRHVLKIMGVQRILRMTNTVQEALAALTPGSRRDSGRAP